MRVYTRSDFLKLPAGTVYCQGERWYFGGLTFKGESLDNDWYQVNPAWVDGKDSTECFERLEEMLNNRMSYPMQGDECRDGLFDANLFLVLEKDDLLQLREWIDVAVRVCT